MSLALLLLAPSLVFAELHVVIVEGLGGDQAYAEQFSAQVDAIEVASATLTADDNIKVFRKPILVSRDAILSHFTTLAITPVSERPD